MKDPKYSKPTEAELEILQVLWNHGPSTVRQVHEKISEAKEVGYTTTLKLMQNMAKKGFLLRDEESRSHIYTASIDEKNTQQALLDRFMQTAFGGSAMKLVMQALGNRKTSKEELRQIRELIEKMEGGEK